MSASPPSDADPNGRDAKGRFVPGNRCGLGNPSAGKMARLRAAALDAVGPEDVRALVARALEAALAGDVQAMRFLADRVLGTPRVAAQEAEPLPIDLGNVESLDGCASATARILEGVATGSLSIEEGERVLGLVAGHRASIEARLLDDISARLRDLEEGHR